MQHPFLRLLPVPDTLGARLALAVLIIALVAVVLALLVVLELAGLAPVDMRDAFSWVVCTAALAVLGASGVLWRLISRDVLRPLEQMQTLVREEEQTSAGLGQVAVTLRELRAAVDSTRAELDQSHRTLRQAEKLALVGKLAAGVAHSVRNPLTSVKLRLFSLERSLKLTEKQHEDFAVISDAIRSVDGIVSSFLEFSRRPSLQLRRVAPSVVVDAALGLLESRLATFPVSTSVHRPAFLPDIHADPEQLCEALLNILLNACEAMDYSGNLHLEESVRVRSNGCWHVCIRIRDSGPGIPEGLLQEIFTPFFSTKEQGTGLGLPIAKSILEEHGGDILVESSPRTGTLFTLLVPAVHPVRPGVPQGPPAP